MLHSSLNFTVVSYFSLAMHKKLCLQTERCQNHLVTIILFVVWWNIVMWCGGIVLTNFSTGLGLFVMTKVVA